MSYKTYYEQERALVEELREEMRVCPICNRHVVHGNAKYPWVIRMRIREHLVREHSILEEVA